MESNDDYSDSDQFVKEEEPEKPPAAPKKKQAAPQQNPSRKSNKNRILFLAKRGVSPVIRHFMKDFSQLLKNPINAKKFQGKNYVMLNELADEKNCNVILLFETRHLTEHYIWFALTPGGPSICFFLENIHMIEDLHLLGKCSQKTRPLLFFDPAFDASPALGIAREILRQTFSPPFTGRQQKVDTAISFYYADDHIWVERHEINFEQENKPALFEAGPRFCLLPVLILGGSFCGKEIYKNHDFVAPHKRTVPIGTKPSAPVKGTEEPQKEEK